MKCFSVLIAAMLVFVSSTHAAECSQESLLAVKSSPEFQAFLAVDCTKLIPVSTPCGQIQCLVALEAVVAILPDCTTKGVELRKDYEARVAKHRTQCKADGSTSPPRRSVTVVPETTKPTALDTTSVSNMTASTDDVPECTTKQLKIISADIYKDAWLAACKSPVGTDEATETKRICGKPCLDAWKASVDDRPRCKMGGRKYYESEEEGYTQAKDLCAKTVSETSDSATSPTTSTTTPSGATQPSTAPTTTPAPASSSSTSIAIGVSAMAGAAVAALLQL